MEPIGFRKERAQEILAKHHIDILIASTPVNIFYASGLPTLHVAPNPILYVLTNQFPNAVLINAAGEEYLIHWMLYQSAKIFTWVTDTDATVAPKMTLEHIGNKIKAWGFEDKPATIGVESHMPKYQIDFLRERFPKATFVDGDLPFLEMRMIKTPEELKRIQQSTAISEMAIRTTIESLKSGITDFDLLQVARRSIVDQGAEGWDHLTFGIGASDPEAPGQGITVNSGDLCRFDIGTVWQGYISDISREAVVGDIPANARDAMTNMIKLQEFCEQQVKPGVNPKELSKIVKKQQKEIGLKSSSFVTIHGLGLEVEEVHFISPMKTNEIVFQPNMVMDIEVWQMISPFGLVGIEDCYRVTTDGVERISTLDKNIIYK
jgi:Xaa-Pro dipeptidase